MIFLSKFCRICIKTGEKLLDIDTKDYDLIKFSEKLQICTKMVINKESLSTQICMSCVKKLRISYIFHDMCCKSTDILQDYLSELLSTTEELNAEKVINSELRVTITPIPKIKIESQLKAFYDYDNQAQSCRSSTVLPYVPVPYQFKQKAEIKKRKRVSKGERCSLLKKLLASINNISSEKTQIPIRKNIGKKVGGLKDLLVFTKAYDFGYNFNCTENIFDCTPLDRLEDFSKTFFYTDFTDYRKTILSILQHEDDSENDEMFNSFDEEEDNLLWNNLNNNNPEESKVKFEEVNLPALNIKKEYSSENVDNCESSDSNPPFLPSELVQACYDENENSSTIQNAATIVKKEFVDFESYFDEPKTGNKLNSKPAAMQSSSRLDYNPYTSILHQSLTAPSSLELLQQFANSGSGKTFSRTNLKCRTRGHPFINPQLKEQFQMRSFKCDTCNRRFKSPGYLHSHCTKMGH